MSDAGVINQRVGRGAVRTDTLNDLTDDPRAQPTPEEALEAANLVIKQQGDQLADQNARLSNVEKTAAQVAEEARVRNLDQQGAQIDGVIRAAREKHAAATTRWKAARNAGDENAEASAIGEMTDASAEVKIAEQNRRNFDAWKANQLKRPVAQSEKPQDNEASPQAREWLSKHPLFFKEGDYRADALAAHEAAIAAGISDGADPERYVKFVDARLEAVYGKNHGQLGRTREEPVRPNRSSTATPPSRGGDDFSSSGDFTFQHADGSKLTLKTERDDKGAMVERVYGTMPAEWREFAKVNHMTELDYARAQLKIQHEIQTGGDAAGLTMNRSGVYK